MGKATKEELCRAGTVWEARRDEKFDMVGHRSPGATDEELWRRTVVEPSDGQE